jgi:hypothetical protein
MRMSSNEHQAKLTGTRQPRDGGVAECVVDEAGPRALASEAGDSQARRSRTCRPYPNMCKGKLARRACSIRYVPGIYTSLVVPFASTTWGCRYVIA